MLGSDGEVSHEDPGRAHIGVDRVSFDYPQLIELLPGDLDGDAVAARKLEQDLHIASHGFEPLHPPRGGAAVAIAIDGARELDVVGADERSDRFSFPGTLGRRHHERADFGAALPDMSLEDARSSDEGGDEG
ncbi:hypothetical protein STIAU_4232, partial [Stigmatella aurantiaca DW4/3-1]